MSRKRRIGYPYRSVERQCHSSGGVGVQVGGLDVVAVAGCHCWVPLLGIGGWVGVHVGGLDVVTLLGAVAIAGLPLLGAIAGLPLLGAIAGDRVGWVYKLADWMW